MLPNDVLILREAIGKLVNKLEENEEITADETNAVVEAIEKCVGSIHKPIPAEPEGPTKATFLEASILKLKFWKICFSLLGYLNQTFLNSMFPLIGVLTV